MFIVDDEICFDFDNAGFSITETKEIIKYLTDAVTYLESKEENK